MPNEQYYVQDCRSGSNGPQPGRFNGGDVYADMRQQRYASERGQPQESRLMNEQAYEQKVESTFTKAHRITDSNNYRENLFSAAENQKPVVMVFGRGTATDGPVLDAVARAKQAAGEKADFMYVDLNKVDANSPIGKYAQYIGRPPYGTPMTMVFTQRQNDPAKGETEQTPVIPERPLHWQVGSPINEQTLMAGIDRAKTIQESYGPIKTGRERKPDTLPETDEKPKPSENKEPTSQEIFRESLQPWKDQKANAMFDRVPPEKRSQVISDMIKQADESGVPDVQARVRAVVGLASIHWGNEADKAGRKEDAMAHYMRGCEFLMNAGEIRKDPNDASKGTTDLYRLPGFQQALRDSKLPGTAANFLIEKGQNDPTWFRPTDASQYGQKWEEYMNTLYSQISGKQNVENDPLLNAVKDRFKPKTQPARR